MSNYEPRLLAEWLEWMAERVTRYDLQTDTYSALDPLERVKMDVIVQYLRVFQFMLEKP